VCQAEGDDVAGAAGSESSFALASAFAGTGCSRNGPCHSSSAPQPLATVAVSVLWRFTRPGCECGSGVIFGMGSPVEKLWKSCGKPVEKLWKSCGKHDPLREITPADVLLTN